MRIVNVITAPFWGVSFLVQRVQNFVKLFVKRSDFKKKGLEHLNDEVNEFLDTLDVPSFVSRMFTNTEKYIENLASTLAQMIGFFSSSSSYPSFLLLSDLNINNKIQKKTTRTC